ncbi:uncharacterized protein [Dendropsophus ebraccatus]|uniref:uncharacterized protein isoform X2 n=1 Tax=Dendropsophus ebraccatus TaxID=150705 RepID=UPI003831DDA3
MDTKHLRSRRTDRERLADRPLPKENGLTSCNGNNEKTSSSVIDNHDSTSTKNTKTLLLEPTLTVDRKFPKNKVLISGAEASPARRDVIPIGSVCNNLTSLHLSSTDSKNSDNIQRRPAKLAPLDLPAQVKEAQMKKMTMMADSVCLSERKASHCNTPYHCPTKRDPLKKVHMRDNKLPKLLEDVTLTKDNVLGNDDVSGQSSSLPRNLHLGDSSLSIIKAKCRPNNGSIPKTISSHNNGSIPKTISSHNNGSIPKPSHHTIAP